MLQGQVVITVHPRLSEPRLSERQNFTCHTHICTHHTLPIGHASWLEHGRFATLWVQGPH